MKFKRTSPELIDVIGNALLSVRCEGKRMFGAMAYFVNGNMFAGAHQDALFLRLSADDQKSLMGEFDEVSGFEPMPGRRMREYVAIPESVFSQPGVLGRWVEISHRYVSSLPQKMNSARNKST